MFSKKVPLITVHDQPYLISVLSKSIEIRTDEPSVLIQVFPTTVSSQFTQTFIIQPRFSTAHNFILISPSLQTVEVPRPRLATRASQGRVYIAAQGLVRHLSFVDVVDHVVVVVVVVVGDKHCSRPGVHRSSGIGETTSFC